MNKLVPRILALALVATTFAATSATPAGAAPPVFLPDPFNTGNCIDPALQGGGNTGTGKDENGPYTITVPAGTTVTTVYVKDGANLDGTNNPDPNLPPRGCAVFTEIGIYSEGGEQCYQVSSTNNTFTGSTTITVTTLSGGGAGSDNCGAISHIEWTALVSTGPPGGGGNPPDATPELDSLVLFGVGALGLAGYGLYQRRRSTQKS
jgi:hypothetical protein